MLGLITKQIRYILFRHNEVMDILDGAMPLVSLTVFCYMHVLT